MEVREARVFVTVAETGSFRQAAQRLHLTQPAISATVRKIEQELQCTLFTRGQRGVELTEMGAALLPLARDLIHTAERLREQVHANAGDLVGVVRVGCSTSLGKYFFPLALARFRSRHPRARAIVLIADRQVTLQRLLDGEVDFMLSSVPVMRVTLAQRALFEDKICLIVPVHHPWAGREAVSPRDLFDVPIIMREPGAGTRILLEEELYRLGLDPARLNVVMEVGNPEAIGMAVEAGVGVSFVSDLLARRLERMGAVKRIPVTDMNLRRTLYLVTNRRASLRPTPAAFLRFLESPEAQEIVRQLR